MKWMRVLRRVTSGTFKYCWANSCARLSALPWIQEKRLGPTGSLIVNMQPNARIGNVAEGRKIDIGNEIPACSRQDHDLVLAILRDAVEGIDEFGVILRRKGEWAAARVKPGEPARLRHPASVRGCGRHSSSHL
jgi:hypothetical protein